MHAIHRRERTTMVARTCHLEIDGARVGPRFDTRPDQDEDHEAPHRWMADHHPGCGYTIVSVRSGHCCRRANYAAAVQPQLVDYGTW
jgi:hypothetical protein